MEGFFILAGLVFLVLPVLLAITALVRVSGQGSRLRNIELQLDALRRRMDTATAPERPASGATSVPRAGKSASRSGISTNETPASSTVEGDTAPQPATPISKPEELAASPPPAGPWSNLAHALGRGSADGASGAQERPSAEKSPRDIESALGARWAVWVGGVALALGGIFLVRYTIEAGLLGPGTRIVLAAIMGLALVAAAEYLRRTELKIPAAGINNAYLPGILTAAGVFTLFGATYAAHGVYGFIGPAPAYVLLALIGIATIVSALVHGQALGGLGVLASLATPMLVSSQAPNPWALFGFLAIVVAATSTVARMRDWLVLATGAYAGAGIWCLAYLRYEADPAVAPAAFITLVCIAGLSAIWLYGRETAAGTEPVRRRDLPAVTVAIFAGLAAVLMDGNSGTLTGSALAGTLTVLLAMIGAALVRRSAALLFSAAGIAAIFWQVWITVRFVYPVVYVSFPAGPSGGLGEVPASYFPAVTALALVFLAAGLFQARKEIPPRPKLAASWALWGGLVPLATVALCWFGFGDLNVDLPYALAALALATVLAAGGEAVAIREEPPHSGGKAVSALLSVSAAALVLAFHAATNSGLTAVLCGLAIAIPAAATRLRTYPALPGICVAFAAVALARIALDPSIVGNTNLGSTPVFNWLLPAYGIPALASAWAAWQLKRTADGKMRMVMEAAATLFALLTFAILVRHAMNGGQITGGPPSLAEQAIYTLIAIGGGAVLLILDNRNSSPVFHFGSIVLGAVSVAAIVVAHFMTLNPLLTNESTGRIAFFNLLLIAYLVPGVSLAALAWYARHNRPRPYVAALALVSAGLVFTYVTLSVRRIFWGEHIASWKGLTQLENYTYSAVWLALGVVLLVAGVRFNSMTIRLASAALVVLAVAKVFLFDMAQLEGVLRALSFIGLGLVLMGIGLFYQRLLVRR